MYAAQSFAPNHHTISQITVIARRSVSGGASATMQTPQGRVGEFGGPTFAGQQELQDEGLQHADSVSPPDVYRKVLHHDSLSDATVSFDACPSLKESPGPGSTASNQTSPSGRLPLMRFFARYSSSSGAIGAAGSLTN